MNAPWYKLQAMEGTIVTVVRWTARIMSALSVLLVLAIVFGEGIPTLGILTTTEILLFASFITMLLGLIIAWKLEGLGGLLVIGGFVFFSVVERSIFSGLISLFPLMGFMFLFCWWRTKRRHGQRVG